MNIAMTFKNFEPSDHLRDYATRRFEKLRRFVPKSENVEMTVVLTVDKFRHKADVQFSADAVNLSAQEQSADMYATVDMVLDKLQTQLKKHFERMKEKRRSAGQSGGAEPFAFSTEAEQEAKEKAKAIPTERVEPKPLFVEEAVLQLEQRAEEAVLVFRNAETYRINILYRRGQGGMGLIDPDM